jgi:hypothetical protein
MRLRNDKKHLQELCNIFLQRNLHSDQLVCINFQAVLQTSFILSSNSVGVFCMSKFSSFYSVLCFGTE